MATHAARNGNRVAVMAAEPVRMTASVGEAANLHGLLSIKHHARLAVTDAFSEALEFSRRLAADELVPKHMRVIGSHRIGGAESLLAVGETDSVYITSRPRSTYVVLAASSEERLRQLLGMVRNRAGNDEPDPDAAILRQWVLTRNGPRSDLRKVAVPDWRDISRNYPAEVRRRLGRTMHLVRPATTARLIVWYGPPGTGKTTALQALIREWLPWCEPHLIPDADAFFGNAEYLHDVLGHEPDTGVVNRDDGPPPKRWKLVIAEDADDYIRADAKARSSAALGRLLNSTDGILGRGMDTVILVTTNDDLARIHPALTRPGRCLDAVEFTAFSPHEAREWLGASSTVADHGATLAELFYLRGDLSNPDGGTSAPPQTGAYL